MKKVIQEIDDRDQIQEIIVQGEHQEIIAQKEEVFQEMKIQEERDIVDINKSLNPSIIFPYYQERALVTSK